jgi:hypothetical protein
MRESGLASAREAANIRTHADPCDWSELHWRRAIGLTREDVPVVLQKSPTRGSLGRV